jgi:hypothetical protein
MKSGLDLLRIEVVNDEIVVSLAKSQLSVTYYKPDKSPRFVRKANDGKIRSPHANDYARIPS